MVFKWWLYYSTVSKVLCAWRSCVGHCVPRTMSIISFWVKRPLKALSLSCQLRIICVGGFLLATSNTASSCFRKRGHFLLSGREVARLPRETIFFSTLESKRVTYCVLSCHFSPETLVRNECPNKTLRCLTNVKFRAKVLGMSYKLCSSRWLQQYRVLNIPLHKGETLVGFP